MTAAQSELLGPVTAAEVEAAATELRATLPIRVDDLTTVVGIRAEGTEFVYDLTVSDTVSRDEFLTLRDAMQQNNQANFCANADIAGFFRRGGSMRHIYIHSSGGRIETRVNSCPAMTTPVS